MRIRTIIKTKLLKLFPPKTFNTIERNYLYFYYGSKYVANDVKVFKKLCDRKKISLDVGANWGLMTLYLSQYSSHVYCFEPIPWLNKGLHKKFRDCNVTVFGNALGNNYRQKELRIPWSQNKRFDTRGSLVKEFLDEKIEGNSIQKIEKIIIQEIKLDCLGFDNIGFMKIDVEGYEMQVLEGGLNTIKTNMPNIFIEIEEKHLGGGSIEKTFDYIKSLGYKGYFYFSNKLYELHLFNKQKMQNVINENDKKLYVSNFIFIPKNNTITLAQKKFHI